MARRISESTRHFTILTTALMAFIVLVTLPAKADLVYSVKVCSTSDPCTPSGPPNGAPPAGYLNGLNNAAFVSFFSGICANGANNCGSNPQFGWHIGGANANGYVWGTDSGPSGINTAFIFYQGAVICCVADAPWYIYGLNDNNLLVANTVGNPAQGGPIYPGYLGSVTDIYVSDFPVSVPYSLDAASVTLLRDLSSENNFQPIITFNSIDNDNDIFGTCSFCSSGVTSLEFVPIPEPSSLVLMCTGLLMIAFL